MDAMDTEVKGRKKRGIGINGKLVGLLLPTITLVLAIILLVLYRNTSQIVKNMSEELLETNTQSVVNDVQAWMDGVLTQLGTERDAMQYFDLDEEGLLAYVKHAAGRNEAYPAGIYMATTQGRLLHPSFVPGPEYSVFEKDWFNLGLKADAFTFGAAYLDAASGNLVVGIYGNVKAPSGRVIGAASADLYLTAVSDIVRQVQLEETGGIFLVETQSNTIIGHREDRLVGAPLTADSGALYGYVSQQIAKGSLGLQTFRDESGAAVHLNLAQVPGSDWVAVAYVPSAEVMSELNALTIFTVAIALAAILILVLLVTLLVRRTVVRPIRLIDAVALRIAGGNLEQTIDFRSNDEFGDLARNFNQTVTRLRDYVNYIDEISAVLRQIADGELTFTLQYDYAGEFAKVRDALEHISASLNSTLGQIGQSAEQVSAGSEQVSIGAQALSQGATEQASAVEELAATVDEVSEQIQHNAADAQQARALAVQVGGEMGESDRQMGEMTAAMSRISESAGEIGKIIKTIEDIAFQTNILALNAAVEAARAGSAGKGFAVVADEVRNLATKSSEASKSTAALIARALQAVEDGAEITGGTARSLRKAAEGAQQVVQTVERISEASGRQAESIAQISQGMDQISSVVQTNSATAEESAASSEELSAQAQMMKELVGRFRLREEAERRSGSSL